MSVPPPSTDAQHVLRTAWAALLVISVSEDFQDAQDREDMAETARVIEWGADPATLSAIQVRLMLEALLLVFRSLQEQRLPQEGDLIGLLTPERLGLAYLTLADLADRQAGAEYDLAEAALASVSLVLFELRGEPVMSDELRARLAEVVLVRDTLEDLLNTGSPFRLPDGQTFTLRQCVVQSLNLLGVRPEILDDLGIMPDLQAALTGDRLNALLRHLTARRQSTVGQA